MNSEIKNTNVPNSAAIFVSIVAVVISLYLGIKANQHNKLSVSPYIDISYSFGGDEKLSSGVRMNNPGLGTAIIHSMWVSWKDENGEVSKSPDWRFLNTELNIENPARQVRSMIFKKGNSIKSGSDDMMLFGLNSDSPESSLLLKNIQRGNIDVTICYESLYNEFKESSLQLGTVAVSNCKVD